eukprot:jgi/Hompol1/1484/HPOL_001308-RA
MALMQDRFSFVLELVGFARINPGTLSKLCHLVDLSVFFEAVTDALGAANAMTAPVLMELATNMLHIGADQIKPDLACLNALDILNENWSASKYWPRLLETFSLLAFHHAILRQPQFMEPDSFVSKIFSALVQWGETRVGIMNLAATKIYEFWSGAVDQDAAEYDSLAIKSIEMHIDWMIEMLTYGPLRESDALDQRHEALIALKVTRPLLSVDELAGYEGTAAWNFAAKDYVIRVQANDILLRLQRDNIMHAKLAKAIFQRLMQTQMQSKFTNQFVNTPEQRRQFVELSEAQELADKLVQVIILEQLAETRSYVEWALARLLISFPSLLPAFWNHVGNFEYRAHAISSLLAVAIHVGPHLSSDAQPDFFSSAILSFVPWTTSNHFNIRLFAQYGLHNFWNMCHQNKHLASVAQKLEYFDGLMTFIATNPECIRHRKKCDLYYFMGGGLHPTRDVNVEFLFRGAPTILQLADDEKISS